MEWLIVFDPESFQITTLWNDQLNFEKEENFTGFGEGEHRRISEVEYEKDAGGWLPRWANTNEPMREEGFKKRQDAINFEIQTVFNSLIEKNGGIIE